MPRISRLWVLTLGLLVSTSINASAQLTPYTFAGSVLDELEAVVNVGDPFQATFLFDEAATPTFSDPDQTVFSSPDATLNGTMGGLNFTGIGRVTQAEAFGTDWWEVHAAVSAPPVVDANGQTWQLRSVGLIFGDNTGTALDGHDTLVPLVFDDYAFTVWDAQFVNVSDPTRIVIVGGVITSMQESVQTLLSQLVFDVMAMNLQAGISNALDSKLGAVISVVDDIRDQNDGAAVGMLYAFINSVEAQRGKKLSSDQADYLITAARNIIAALGG